MHYKIENRRYTGSKAKLVNWIVPLIQKECKGDVFVDIFAGTGVVTATVAKIYNKIIINDILYSNFVIYDAFLGKENYNEKKIDKIINEYNLIDPNSLEQNYFSNNFGGKYFNKNTARLIGYIREDIEKKKKTLTKREYNILLTILLYAVDKIANTVGHYDAYIREEPKEKAINLRMIQPISTKKVEIYREDANDLARKINGDIIYIDPPYNSRQYSRFYHVLETLIKWNKPKLFGTALKPMPENTSDYCRVKAPVVFKDLIDNLDCKYLVVSYNNTYNSKSHSSRNKIELGEIKNILNRRGKTKIFKKNHKFFNSGKTKFNNHQEWLFITKVYE